MKRANVALLKHGPLSLTRKIGVILAGLEVGEVVDQRSGEQPFGLGDRGLH
jgi:hypothetical protein